ncbi:MAG: D-alanyl-D-alanine carboxypeptidase [Ruminococcaceae bacterium]|nr:D-alanyl-D-alanine carboxypeptidase [Oscillospiraceae bacterium]
MKRFLSLVIVFSLIFSVKVYANDVDLKLSARSAILMDYETGEVLYSHNPHEKLPPASVTKIMSMLLIMEEIAQKRLTYDDMVTGSERAKSMGGSTIFLDEGESLSVRDMLKGIAVASGNDATVAMAEHISGTVEAFVDKMNNRAKELGMKNTHFITCNGLDADGHYSSAYDIALMSRELMKYEDIFKFTTIWMDSLRDGEFTLSNTNKLIRFYEGATGLKTGSTSIAKNCISATAKRDGMHLIAVVMAAPTSKDRFSDASKMLNFGFNTYKVTTFRKTGDSLGFCDVKKGKENKAEMLYNTGFGYLSKKSESKEIEEKIIINKDIIAPLSKGDIIGKAEFYQDGKLLGSSDIISASDIEKKSLSDAFKDTFDKFLTKK